MIHILSIKIHKNNELISKEEINLNIPLYEYVKIDLLKYLQNHLDSHNIIYTISMANLESILQNTEYYVYTYKDNERYIINFRVTQLQFKNLSDIVV